MSIYTQPARPGVLQLALRDKGALYAAYIPWFAQGGLFVATSRPYRLGEDVYLLLTLPDDPQRYPVAGRVGWITPAGAGSSNAQGIGVVLPNDAGGLALKAKIEHMLGSALASDMPTLTL